MVNGFGMPSNTREDFKEYEGTWIIVYPHGFSTTFGGYCVEVKGGYAILNPFQGGSWDAEKGLTKKLIEGNSRVPLVNSAVEPSTEEDIRNACEYFNAKNSETESQKSD